MERESGEKILEIVQVFKYLSKKKLLVFINATAYLSKDELVNLIEYIQLNQLRVLFVEEKFFYEVLELCCFEWFQNNIKI